MKKILATSLIASSMILTLIGCGTAQKVSETPAAPAVEVAEEAQTPEVEAPEVSVEETVVEPVIEEPVIEEPVEEEPVVEPTYVEEKGLRVVNLADCDNSYTEVYTFIEFNKDENKNPIPDHTALFDSQCTVSFDSVDNGDGTKTISYTCIFDTRDWSLEYDFYSSQSYLMNMETGEIFSDTYAPNKVIVDGKTSIVDYNLESIYAEDYSTHTKIFSLTCPVEFEGYAMYLGDATKINEVNIYENVDIVLGLNDETTKTVVH